MNCDSSLMQFDMGLYVSTLLWHEVEVTRENVLFRTISLFLYSCMVKLVRVTTFVKALHLDKKDVVVGKVTD